MSQFCSVVKEQNPLSNAQDSRIRYSMLSRYAEVSGIFRSFTLSIFWPRWI
jgi:hypothetical protein